MLPRDTLLKGSRCPQELGALIDLAEEALRTWEPRWSGFVDAEVNEEAQARLGALSEVTLLSDGGWPQAERCRLLIRRADITADGESPAPAAAVCGLVVSGNFLFDPAEPADVRQGLLQAGLKAADLGDLWMRGDRGALAVLSQEASVLADNREAQVRSVPVRLQVVPLEQVQWPALRSPKQLSSVEASLRLDAVGSAGLGLSRSRMADLIRQGAVRVNWQVVTSPSKELRCGDRVRLDGRGELEILEVQPTKRDRWRLVMQRR
ncbi:photosystem II S4 domain protein [Vulcanococcus sp. Clear-D1]|uniref:photosystem II S4 domain protein n=1 Tax=Vulcanococcus sp. Clear-D1 TaxID=2766970 RepID=UPI001995BEB7|nr:photosystem II S4 domain protein [Vulcanococcus sp. Clear-D1]MBD1195089.1 photosystem II S4 domain protein [Vulcanococcus sp. Clear-D1]